jgi:hypothetical protein
MTFIRDVCLLQDRWYLKCPVVGVYGGHIFVFCWCKRDVSVLFSNVIRDILSFVN